MSDGIQTRHYTPTPAVRQAAEDAQYLLAYAVESRLHIDKDVIETLVRSKNVLRLDAWNPREETVFWQAFTKLNAQVKPVTIHSLKSVLPAPDSPSWMRLFTRAHLFLVFYVLLTGLIFISLFFLQVYWFIGNHLVHEIDTLNDQRTDIVRLKQSIQEPASSEGQDLESVEKQLQANYIGLLKWSVYWQKLLRLDTLEGKNVVLNERLSNEQISRLQRKIDMDRGLLMNVSEAQKVIITQRIEENEQKRFQLEQALEAERMEYQRVITELPSKFVLEMLQSYILPMFFGLFGAAIYVLRSVAKEIDKVTYRMGSDIRYGLRLALGALGGLGIGWFLVPEEFSGFLQTVSPLALAFLVGYNIELLFSIMDSFVDSVVKKNTDSVTSSTQAS